MSDSSRFDSPITFSPLMTKLVYVTEDGGPPAINHHDEVGVEVPLYRDLYFWGALLFVIGASFWVVGSALPLVYPEGVLLAGMNVADLASFIGAFFDMVDAVVYMFAWYYFERTKHIDMEAFPFATPLRTTSIAGEDTTVQHTVSESSLAAQDYFEDTGLRRSTAPWRCCCHGAAHCCAACMTNCSDIHMWEPLTYIWTSALYLYVAWSFLFVAQNLPAPILMNALGGGAQMLNCLANFASCAATRRDPTNPPLTTCIDWWQTGNVIYLVAASLFLWQAKLQFSSDPRDLNLSNLSNCVACSVFFIDSLCYFQQYRTEG
jgi:hypothetical protein